VAVLSCEVDAMASENTPLARRAARAPERVVKTPLAGHFIRHPAAGAPGNLRNR
jgi:hypothetical protein